MPRTVEFGIATEAITAVEEAIAAGVETIIAEAAVE
jgi:hypothetical protein